jgi:ribonuclease HIII
MSFSHMNEQSIKVGEASLPRSAKAIWIRRMQNAYTHTMVESASCLPSLGQEVGGDYEGQGDNFGGLVCIAVTNDE